MLGLFCVLEFVSEVLELLARKFFMKHPTTMSQNTSLLDDNLIIEIARCRMQDLVLAIFKDLFIGSYAIG
jgi:hypothetical protein